MSKLQPIRRALQRDERWANGAGSTTVILREPDDGNWLVRISVARVEQAGPFSDLPGTRRILVPLDRPMALRFDDGRTLHATRMHGMQFAGSPAPCGELPEGPTRDFNLMLRGGARGEVLPRTLAGAMHLPPEAGTRWLLYLDSGHARIAADGDDTLTLAPGDAALVTAAPASRVLVEGAGEIVLVKLYA